MKERAIQHRRSKRTRSALRTGKRLTPDAGRGVANAAEAPPEGAGSWASRYFWPMLLGLCLFGLIRGALILQEYMVRNPLARTPISDAETYWDWAESIARGDIVGDQPFQQAPLYPYLLGALRAAGGGLTAVYYLQWVLSVATAGCLAWIGRARFGPAVGLVSAALFLLLDGPAFWSTRVLATTLHIVLVCLLWLVLLYVQRAPSRKAWALAGLLVGVNCLGNGPMMLLVPVLAGWCLVQPGRRSSRVGRVATFLVGAAAVISIATLHNWQATGELIPVAANGGINFRLGNAPGSTGTYTILPGISTEREQMFADATRLYQRETGRPLRWREMDRYFTRQGLNEWKSHPEWALKLALKKLYYFVSGRNYSEIYQLRPEKSLALASRLRLAPIPVAWLMGPAAVGVFWMLRRPKRHWPELMLLAVPLFVVVVFWYSPRFRMPAVPVLAVAGAWAIARAVSWREHPRTSVAVLIALAVAIGLGPANRAIGFDAADEGMGRLGLHLGRAYRDQGRLEESIQAYRITLDSDAPRVLKAQAHNNLGTAAMVQGKPDVALEHYREAVRLDPNLASAQYNLGMTLADAGQRDAALRAFREAMRLAPEWPLPLSSLAWELATDPDPALRDPGAAIDLATRAAELTRRRDPGVLDTLAAAWAASGNFDSALTIAQEALALATAARSERLADRIRARIELYRRGESYREYTPAQERGPRR